MFELIQRSPLGVLGVIRILVGIIFILHGAQKVFGALGGGGLEPFAQYVVSLGFPKFLGYVAAFAEFVGGLLIAFGIVTELGALCVIPLMLVAIFIVHWSHGFFVQNQGYEYPLLLLVIAIGFIFSGPGKWALWDPFSTYITHDQVQK